MLMLRLTAESVFQASRVEGDPDVVGSLALRVGVGHVQRDAVVVVYPIGIGERDVTPLSMTAMAALSW